MKYHEVKEQIKLNLIFLVDINLILFKDADNKQISWMYSNFGQIGPQTLELVALEHLNTTIDSHIMGKMVSLLFPACILT